MHAWLLLLILAAPPEVPSDASSDTPALASVDVLDCDFGEAYDRNFDGWPDNWTRQRGPGYPQFVSAKIVGEPKNAAKPERYALRIDLDGGAAAIHSPPIPISQLFSYRLEADLRTEGLSHDVAYTSLSFFDAEGVLLETHESKHRTHLATWTTQQIGPVLPASSKAATVMVGLHIRPRAAGVSDIEGAAVFSRVKLARLPRVVLRCQNKSQLFQPDEAIDLRCDVSGLLQPNPQVTFSLEDIDGKNIATETMPLISTQATDADADPDKATGFAGQARWKVPNPGYGYYRIRAVMPGNAESQLERVTTIAVLRALPSSTSEGEFGWSLLRGDDDLALQDLLPLVTQAGIHWLKFPMWCSEEDPSRLDRLAWFSDRVGMHHVQMIGVLDTPPPSVRKTFGGGDDLPIATAFIEAPLWKPAIEPVLTRLPLKVRWWQLGADSDQSFVGFPNLSQKMAEVKQHFLKFGQEVKIGMAWPWFEEPPVTQGAPWEFLSHSEKPNLTAAEITAYLQGSYRGNGAPQCWLKLEPLSTARFPLEQRAKDLVERMLAAKMGGAQGIFLEDPFSPQHGLLENAGAPGPLFLPWRTTAKLLSGAEYIGSITLPGGSTNHLFRRDHEALMVVWNDQPTKEKLYLGEGVEHLDLWGRAASLKEETLDGQTTQAFEVGPLPTFITGLSLPVALWRISFQFETTHIPSVLGRDQIAKYKFQNSFGQGVGGELRVQAPSDWEATPLTINFKAAANEEKHESFAIRLKADAQSGPQMVRFDVKLTADADYAFSVYRSIHVGANDLFITTSSALSDNGDLIVEQIFTNQTDEFVSFNCLLFAPGRRRERIQVVNLGRGRHTATFILPQGEELLGQTLLLRAEEINGDRVLNYRIAPQE